MPSGHWSAPSLEWRRELGDFFSGGQAVAELEVRRVTAAVDVGYQFGRFGEIRLGLERGAATVDVLAGQLPAEVVESIEIDDVDFGGVVFEGTYDRLDSSGIPPRRLRPAARLPLFRGPGR